MPARDSAGRFVVKGTVIGAERVIERFRGIIPEEVRTRTRDAVHELGLTLERKVKLEKLEGQVLHRRSGRLVRSINTKFSDSTNTFTASVGTRLSYGRAWELGFHGTVSVKEFVRGNTIVRAHTRNVNMDARPFLKPSLDEMRLMIRERLALAMRGL